MRGRVVLVLLAAVNSGQAGCSENGRSSDNPGGPAASDAAVDGEWVVSHEEAADPGSPDLSEDGMLADLPDVWGEDIRDALQDAVPDLSPEAVFDVQSDATADTLPDTPVSDAGSDACTPQCDGKACGDDGCGGMCGQCEDHHECQTGACVYQPWCGDAACDQNLLEDCATCPLDCPCGCGETCVGGLCMFTACEGMECGDDGCGGQCGVCKSPQEECVLGECISCDAVCAALFCGDSLSETCCSCMVVDAAEENLWSGGKCGADEALVALGVSNFGAFAAAEGPCLTVGWYGVVYAKFGGPIAFAVLEDASSLTFSLFDFGCVSPGGPGDCVSTDDSSISNFSATVCPANGEYEVTVECGVMVEFDPFCAPDLGCFGQSKTFNVVLSQN